MAGRGRPPGFYVYRIFDRVATLYVGKGSGRRLEHQRRKFGCDGEVVEDCATEPLAFERERFWIAELRPTENVRGGGNGGWVHKAKPRKTKVQRELEAELALIERTGTREYVRAFLRKMAGKFPQAFTKVQLSQIKALA